MRRDHLTRGELEAALDHLRQAPADGSPLELIIRRPRENAREVVAEAELDLHAGLVGDCWSTAQGTPDPEAQLTIMGTRAIGLIAGDRARWPLAGDQLYVDLDLSFDNLPPGSRLAVGTAVVEVTALPHLGCGKFSERFGRAATLFFNSPVGVKLNLRGVNAKVVRPGRVAVGDQVRKVSAS